MKILSNFNGISCGRVALDRTSLQVDKYYSSEIEPNAIKIADKNYPQDIKNKLGDITKWRGWNIGNIDLLIGGSPCQGLSRANVERKNLEDFRSKLFFEYYDIFKNCNPKWFLLENVKMDIESQNIISELLGVEPISINSNLLSAQNRERLYWTNIPIKPIEDKKIILNDILELEGFETFQDERIDRTRIKTKNYYKWDTSGKGYYSQQDRAYFKDNKMCCIPKSQVKSKLNIVEDEEKGIYRRILPIECERLQTLPDNYTKCEGVSTTKRFETIGNGWTVDVIAHILKGIEI